MMITGGLIGCSWIGAEPTEAERTAERLRTPPNLLEENRERDDRERANASVSEPDTQAGRDPASYLTTYNDQVALNTGLPADAGWAILGRALDRSGFALIESDDSARTHGIRYDTNAVIGLDDDANDAAPVTDERGVFERLAFWRSAPEAGVQRYQLRVSARDNGSRIVVEQLSGDPAPDRAARQVLVVVAEQLKP
ncbi:MAG: hypothetical protein RI514_01420 [Spiribacter sp.]|nr:hypothetical protein [Spiribacter sp.]